MTIITALDTFRVSDDGFKLRRIHAGETVELAHSAAAAVMNAGLAIPGSPTQSIEEVVDNIIRHNAYAAYGRLVLDIGNEAAAKAVGIL
jgi:hypothetical protein